MSGVKRALIGLALLPALAVGCGSSKTPTATTAPATAQPVAVTGPDGSQIAEAHDLAAKLGCPKVVATPGGGASNGSADAECAVTPPPGADEFSSLWHYEISVFPNTAALTAYIAQVRAAYNPEGVQGDRWVVMTGSAEDAALANAVKKVGGQQL